MRPGRAALLPSLLTLAIPALANAGQIGLQRIGTFQGPVYVTAAPGDPSRVFVVERAGRVRVLVNDQLQSTPFLDISSLVATVGEGGLLSVAFAPDYQTSGRLYAYYTGTDPDNDIRVRELRRAAGDPNRADPATGRQVLRVPHPLYDNHVGGQLQFGPDGYLYVGTGDGGLGGDPGDNAQQPNALLGKLLRLDPRGAVDDARIIPPDNPFADGRLGRPEVFAIGLRNPWRFSFDRQTGAIVIGDVGQGAWEEVDYVPSVAALRGANFGWRRYEGTRVYGTGPAIPGTVRPIHEYSHDDGSCSITGGYVVRDPQLPSLVGRYLYADYCVGRLRSLIPTGSNRNDTAVGVAVEQPTSFGEDGRCRIHVTSETGAVYRLVESGVPPGPGCAAAPDPAPGPGPAPGPAPAQAALLAGLKVAPSLGRTALTRTGITATCSANAPGTCRVFVGLAPREARRLGATGRLRDGIVVIGGGATAVTGAGSSPVRLRLGTRAARVLAARRGSVALRLQIEISARDARAVTVRRVIRIRL